MVLGGEVSLGLALRLGGAGGAGPVAVGDGRVAEDRAVLLANAKAEGGCGRRHLVKGGRDGKVAPGVQDGQDRAAELAHVARAHVGAAGRGQHGDDGGRLAGKLLVRALRPGSVHHVAGVAGEQHADLWREAHVKAACRVCRDGAGGPGRADGDLKVVATDVEEAVGELDLDALPLEDVQHADGVGIREGKRPGGGLRAHSVEGTAQVEGHLRLHDLRDQAGKPPGGLVKGRGHVNDREPLPVGDLGPLAAGLGKRGDALDHVGGRTARDGEFEQEVLLARAAARKAEGGLQARELAAGGAERAGGRGLVKALPRGPAEKYAHALARGPLDRCPDACMRLWSVGAAGASGIACKPRGGVGALPCGYVPKRDERKGNLVLAHAGVTGGRRTGAGVVEDLPSRDVQVDGHGVVGAVGALDAADQPDGRAHGAGALGHGEHVFPAGEPHGPRVRGV